MNKIKDPGSAITHFIGMLMALFAAFPLMLKSYHDEDSAVNAISLLIFILSMIMLYAASTTYHAFDVSEKVNTVLRKIDHAMIFILIAGSYTPICLIALKGRTGIIMLSVVWGISLLGILFKILWINCPLWVSSIMYIMLGWTCVTAFTPLVNNLSKSGLLWLLTGGVIYTIGGIIYALKFPVFNSKHKNFGSHEIFHLFVMAGSCCHFMLMYGLA